MNTKLSQLAPGFDHEAFGSQAVFRVALHALAHPGRVSGMPLANGLPLHGHGSAAALLLGLLDADTPLWLSPSLASSDAAVWLRFHTGCPLVADTAQAQFIWVALGDEVPALNGLPLGSDTYPDTSATCILETTSLQTDPADDTGCWTLQGPGILGQCRLQVSGLPADFPAQWALNHASFPRGVDVLLTTPTQLVGLPRTTRILTPLEA